MQVRSAPDQARANRAYGLSKYCSNSGDSAAISVRHWSMACEHTGSFSDDEKPSMSYP